MRDQAERLLALGAKAVLIKGGHGSGPESVDLLVERDTVARLAAPTHRDAEHARHRLHAVVGDRRRASPRGCALHRRRARRQGATSPRRSRPPTGCTIGSGHGPVHHFHRWW